MLEANIQNSVYIFTPSILRLLKLFYLIIHFIDTYKIKLIVYKKKTYYFIVNIFFFSVSVILLSNKQHDIFRGFKLVLYTFIFVLIKVKFICPMFTDANILCLIYLNK